MIRNLFYQICPISHNNEWKFNLDHLRKHLHKFNGKLIFIIKTGHLMVDKKDVLAYLSPPEKSTILFMDNNPELGEANGFFKGLDLLKSHQKDEITFYAHTKGVSPNYLEEDRYKIRGWTAFMYDYNLNNIEAVDNIMENYACCGCLKVGDKYMNVPVAWHYCGSFYWFRHDKVFDSPEFSNIGPASYYSSEFFLGFLIPESEAFCIAGENCDRLYALSTKEWDAIRKENNTICQN
jgi:hypothetical protein